MSETNVDVDRRVGWRTTDKPLPPGWYWWRCDPEDPHPEINYSDGTANVRISLVDLDYVAEEEFDWSGEWYGPIEPPNAELCGERSESERAPG